MKTIKCEYCDGTGINLELQNYYSLFDPFEEPDYQQMPCDECGGYGKLEEE